MKCKLSTIWPWLLGIFFVLWLYIAFYSACGYEEILIPVGTEQVTMPFSRISNILPIEEQVEEYARVEENSVSLTITFTDVADGTVSQVSLENARIHVDGYTNVDNVQTPDLPLMLEAGHTYTVEYEAVCAEEPLVGLAFSIYGDEISYLWMQSILLVVVLLGAGCLFYFNHGGKHVVPTMLLLWCALYVLYLLSMPIKPQLQEEEQQAFGRAYAVSNEMLGLDTTDEDGNVYVDDINLINSGYLSYDVPLYRFWSHIGSAAETTRAATVTYPDDGVLTPRTYLDAVAITAARRIGCSYSMVYLSGSLLVSIVVLAVFGIVLVRCRKESTRIRIMSVMVLPSVFSAILFHSGVEGLFRPIDQEYAWLWLDDVIRRVILYVTPYDSAALIITWVPIVILGTFLWNDLHKKTMPIERERALLTGMVLVSAVTALLRLQM